jgi:hypothetical protein
MQRRWTPACRFGRGLQEGRSAGRREALKPDAGGRGAVRGGEDFYFAKRKDADMPPEPCAARHACGAEKSVDILFSIQI